MSLCAAAQPLLDAHYFKQHHQPTNQPTMVFSYPTPSPPAREVLYRKWHRKIPANDFYARNITPQNALMCLSTAANSDRTDEFGFVMSYIVLHVEAIVEGSDWSIILHDWLLMGRAFNWIVTEFETLVREVQVIEQQV